METESYKLLEESRKARGNNKRKMIKCNFCGSNNTNQEGYIVKCNCCEYESDYHLYVPIGAAKRDEKERKKEIYLALINKTRIGQLGCGSIIRFYGSESDHMIVSFKNDHIGFYKCDFTQTQKDREKKNLNFIYISNDFGDAETILKEANKNKDKWIWMLTIPGFSVVYNRNEK